MKDKELVSMVNEFNARRKCAKCKRLGKAWMFNTKEFLCTFHKNREIDARITFYAKSNG